MKKFSTILGLFMSVAILFSSCGSDDGPDPVVKSLDKTYPYSIPIQGIQNQAQEVKQTLNLVDAVGEEVVNNFVSAEFQRGNSYINIKGLKDVSETAKIKDLKIKIGSRQAVSLGTCTYEPNSNEFNSDRQLSDDKYTELCKYILEDLRSKKKTEIVLTFTPEMTLTTATSPVYFELGVSGLYKYNTYPE